MINDPIAKAVNSEYEIVNIKSRLGTHNVLHKKRGRTKKSGKIVTVQKIGTKDAIIIANFVIKETFESSSQFSFLKVVNRQANEAKLRIDTTGVIKGNTKISKRNRAFIP